MSIHDRLFKSHNLSIYEKNVLCNNIKDLLYKHIPDNDVKVNTLATELVVMVEGLLKEKSVQALESEIEESKETVKPSITSGKGFIRRVSE